MKTDLFQSCDHFWVFQICWHIECSTLTASSFRIWNSSTEIPSPPLALFVVMLSKAHLTLHCRMSGSRWVIKSLSWRFFCTVLLCILATSYYLLLLLGPYHFCSFFEPIFAWNILLLSLIFLKRSPIFPILLFPLFLCIDNWGRLSYLSLLYFETLQLGSYC